MLETNTKKEIDVRTGRLFNAIKPSKFKRIVKCHNLWKKTCGKAGKQAQFSQVSFELVDLSKVDFEFTTITECLFIRNKLIGMRFSAANFDSCHFYDCDMSGSIFSDCSLKGVKIVDSDFSNVTFSSCDLRSSMLAASNLDRAEFLNTSLYSVSLSDSSLREAGFVNCVFLWSSFSRCDLRGARVEPSIKDAFLLAFSKWLRSDVPWWLGHCDQHTIVLCDQ